MSALLEKARAGRANALAARTAHGPDSGLDMAARMSFTAPRREQTATFVSARARGQVVAVL
ncbi:hypothetical protein [Actibacterium mucosum]|uniref:hypothetical protein n=1 Tax=Actibacterium mucosum TaxID=1087332 RepID=UPI0012683ED5|nr:hypothetical protein [Actibacterium mucosum]